MEITQGTTASIQRRYRTTAGWISLDGSMLDERHPTPPPMNGPWELLSTQVRDGQWGASARLIWIWGSL